MPASSAGRPRDVATDAKLLEATLATLRERGPEGVNVEAVSRASGIAKTTIYRRYQNSQELLSAALGSLTFDPPEIDHLPPRDRLVTLLVGFQRGLEDGIGIRSFVALMVEPTGEFARTLRARLLQPRLAAVTDAVGDAQRDGLISSSTSAENIVLMMAGYYFTHRAIRGRPPTRWAEAAVDAWWKE